MLRLKKTKLIKYSLFFIALFFLGCCKYGYTHITISNLSGKDKYFKAHIILKDSIQHIGWKELNLLKANEQDDLIIQRYETDYLTEFEEEKRIVVIFFNSKKDKTATIEKDSIIKKYSMKELENQNWKIEYSEN
jgi:hypothetical protein